MRDYHRLEIWQRAHALAVAIHDVAKKMRGPEFAGLRSKLTRAVDSIAASIVEGCAADSDREFAHCLTVSIKAASEAEYDMLSARDRRAMSTRDWTKYSAEVVEIRRMTYAYRKRLLENDTQENEENRK